MGEPALQLAHVMRAQREVVREVDGALARIAGEAREHGLGVGFGREHRGAECQEVSRDEAEIKSPGEHMPQHWTSGAPKW